MSAKKRTTATVEPEATFDPDEYEAVAFIRDADDNLIGVGDVDLAAHDHQQDIPDLIATLVAFSEPRDREDVAALVRAIVGRFDHVANKALDLAREATEAAQKVAAEPAGDIVVAVEAAKKFGVAEGARLGYSQGRRDGLAAAGPRAAIQTIERDESGRAIGVTEEAADGSITRKRIDYDDAGKLVKVSTVTG